jgi:hypothetical protein
MYKHELIQRNERHKKIDKFKKDINTQLNKIRKTV